MYIFISGFKRLDGQTQAWVEQDVVNVVCTCAYKTMRRKKARSRNETAKLDWKVTGLRNKRL